MSFTDRQKSRYAARQKALHSVQADPPLAIPRGSDGEAAAMPSSPIILSQKTESTLRKRGVEVERGQGTKNNRPKPSQDEDPQKDKPFDSSKENFEQKVRKKRAGEGEVARIKARSPLNGTRQLGTPLAELLPTANNSK